MMKNRNIFKTRVLICSIILLLSHCLSYGQCTNCGSQYPSSTQTVSSSNWSTVSTIIYGSEWHYATLSTGYIYQWTTEGSTFDTQLTLYPSGTCGATTTWHPGPYHLAYNDDYTPPGYPESTITYQPGVTSIRVLLSRYNCTNTTFDDDNSNATVKWRRIPVTPTISASSTTICAGESTTLSAGNVNSDDDFINIMWGTSSGGTQVSSDSYSVSVSPTSTTTYYLRYYVKGTTGSSTTSSGIYSNVASRTITVHQPPTAPTGISVTGAGSTICPGESSTLTATGGSTGTSSYYQWFSGSCGSTVLGTGQSISVNPTTTTTYYVRRVGNSACTNVTSCRSTTITVNTESTIPSSIDAVVNP